MQYRTRLKLFFDGGIRRGEDIVKAHALGATAACSGRCWFWGLAANGEQGVTDVLEILNQETKDTLSLIGNANSVMLEHTTCTSPESDINNVSSALSHRRSTIRVC